jgi:hypothetical protein
MAKYCRLCDDWVVENEKIICTRNGGRYILDFEKIDIPCFVCEPEKYGDNEKIKENSYKAPFAWIEVEKWWR